MADSKITALTALTAADPANDMIPIVDVSDTPPASGNTKRISINNILAASGTATLASATITGDLTVDTSTLKVDSANNRVGIGTASPNQALHVRGNILTGSAAGTDSFLNVTTDGVQNSLFGFNNSGSTNGYGASNNNTYVGSGNNYGLQIIGNSSVLASFSTSGVFNWYDGAGGTRMTLNATGLGIGVTPSAWGASLKVIQIGDAGRSSFTGRTDAFQNNLVLNAYDNGSNNWIYVQSTLATRYSQISGSHLWYTAPSGTAGNTITFTQAMTLTAAGELLVGTTSALFNSRLRVKTSSTSASDYGMYVADSADALIFALRNDGLIYTGTKTASPYNNTTGSAANAFIAADGTLGRSTSSLKYKTDITDSTRGLADVLKLRPVTYKSKNGDDTIFGGLIAEEVHAAGLTEFVAYAPDNAPDAIHYSNMVSLLVAAIKELTARVQTLEAK